MSVRLPIPLPVGCGAPTGSPASAPRCPYRFPCQFPLPVACGASAGGPEMLLPRTSHQLIPALRWDHWVSDWCGEPRDLGAAPRDLAIRHEPIC